MSLARFGQRTRLPVAVVSSYSSNLTVWESFLDSISDRGVIQRPYANLQAAIASVERGDTWGVLSAGSNFSGSGHTCALGKEMNASYTNGITVDIYMNMADKLIGSVLRIRIAEAFYVSSSLVGR